jgi:DNA-binding MarR family transcriptional regulator
MDPDSSVLREIGAISRCIQTVNDVRFRLYGLQKGQFVFLTRICENPGINQIDLSNLLKVDKTTTTKAIQRLTEAGLVEKHRGEADKRMWRLYPKSKALDLYPLIIEEENRNIAICLRGLSDDEKQTVSGLLRIMRENIEKERKAEK